MIFLFVLPLLGLAAIAIWRQARNRISQEPYRPDPRYGRITGGRIVDVDRATYVRGMERPHARYDPVPGKVAARRAAHARCALAGTMDDVPTVAEVATEQAALREERLRLGLDPVTGRPVRQGPAMRVAADKTAAGRRTRS